MPNVDPQSDDALLQRFRAGEELAARLLFERYMTRLTALARARLARKLARRIDPEDVVLSAWRSFFVAARQGKWTADEELWPILATITLRKLARQASRQQAQRRSYQRELSWEAARVDELLDQPGPTPEQGAQLVDELEQLLAHFVPEEREILIRRLRGESPEAIAGSCGCSERTVRRIVQQAREWMLQTANASADAGSSEVPDLEAVWRWLQSRPEIYPPPTAAVEELELATGRLETRNWARFDYADLTLESLAGQGGIGRVYRARWLTTGATVAVKFLKKSFWHNQRAVSQLLRELAIVSAVHIPGMVRYHGYGVTPSGGHFLVLDWIEGCDLRSWRSTVKRTLPVVMDLAIRIAELVANIHERGLIHGDLTPANLLIADDGAVYLTDFGFSRVKGMAIPVESGGTPGFLAPEQISDAFGEVGPQTDIYGLGGLLYFLLTGTPPFSANSASEILASVISGIPPVHLSQRMSPVPCELEELVSSCLSTEPSLRPATARQVAQRLREIQGPDRVDPGLGN